jgi:hypothetical protein
MDLETAKAVIQTASAAVGLFDKVAGQVVRFIRRTPEPAGPPKEFSYKVQAGDELKVESRGQTVQVIKGEDLQKLPADYYSHIKTMEQSIGRYYKLWQKVYPHRDDFDVMTNAKTEAQLDDLALKMKDDLTGIIDFLQSIGVMLDDHYIIYRDVIKRYGGKSDA